jgi:hypothetical protein
LLLLIVLWLLLDSIMDVICNLPMDLFHSLLLTWLGHEDVGRLDTAACHRGQRKHFLSSITDADFVFVNCYRPAAQKDHETRLDLFLRWLMTRGIATSLLPVTHSCVMYCGERLNYLLRNGKHVRRVIISATVAPFDKLKAAMNDVCIHCPGVMCIENNRVCGYHKHAAMVRIVASHCAQLCELYARRGIVDGDLAALGKGCPYLTTVGWMSPNVTDAGILSVARNGALITLCLEWCLKLTDVGLQAAVVFCTHLESVDLAMCNQLTDVALAAIGQHCHNLHKLDISYTCMTGEGIQAIAAGCPLLEVLHAKECSIGSAAEAIARGCPRLRVLSIAGADVPAEAVLALAECCPLLDELEICGCEEVGDETISVLLRGCTALKWLDITGTSITVLGLRTIRDHCKQLKRITLGDGMFPDLVDDGGIFPESVEVYFRAAV